MSIRHIKGNRSTLGVKLCEAWLSAAADMRDHLFAEGDGFDPFRYNETATVGFLVAAAGRAGLFAFPEFTEENRRLPKGRIRAGRCDLWIGSADWRIQWLIEFKLSWYGPRSRHGLITPMNAAIRCAVERDGQEANERWACVVYAPGADWVDETPAQRANWVSHARVDQLAQHVDIAFEVGGPAGPAHVLLKRIPARAHIAERHLLDRQLLRDAD